MSVVAQVKGLLAPVECFYYCSYIPVRVGGLWLLQPRPVPASQQQEQQPQRAHLHRRLSMTPPASSSSSSGAPSDTEMARLSAQVAHLTDLVRSLRVDNAQTKELLAEAQTALKHHSFRLTNFEFENRDLREHSLPYIEQRLDACEQLREDIGALRTDMTQLSYAVSDLRRRLRETTMANTSVPCSCPDCVSPSRRSSFLLTDVSETTSYDLNLYTANGSVASSECVVLTTWATCFVQQRSNCDHLIQLLEQHAIEFREIDCSLEENRALRDRYFEISGVRAKYPQVFIQSRAADPHDLPNDEVHYIGSFDTIQKLSEMESLSLELRDSEDIETISSVFADVARRM